MLGTAPPARSRQWWVFAVAGLLATAVYSLNLAGPVSVAASALIGAGTVFFCFVAPRRFGAEPRAAWPVMGAAALCFLAGVVIRPLVVDQPLIADAFTVPGYVLLGVFFSMLLRSRGSIARHSVLDGLMVCLAGGLASALLLAAPAAAIADRPPIESVLAGLYPCSTWCCWPWAST